MPTETAVSFDAYEIAGGQVVGFSVLALIYMLVSGAGLI